jgi:hypothetical protein
VDQGPTIDRKYETLGYFIERHQTAPNNLHETIPVSERSLQGVYSTLRKRNQESYAVKKIIFKAAEMSSSSKSIRSFPAYQTMAPSKIAALTTLLASATMVAGHGYVSSIVANGKKYVIGLSNSNRFKKERHWTGKVLT